MRNFFTLLTTLLVFSIGNAQCPTLTGPGATQTGSCVGDVVTLTLTGGTNLNPGTQTVDWYASNSPSFTPPAQGTYVGSAAINGGTAPPCSQPPIVLGGLINPCTSANNTSGTNPGSEENEAFFIWSGSGFEVNNFGAEVNNNISAPGQDNIGVLGGCPLLSTPTVPVTGSCAVFVGPGDVVPPNAFVLVFTSSLADLPLDVSVACALGFPVYVMQSSCTRGTVGNVPGALTNGSGGPYQVEFGCPGPGQQLIYGGAGGNNTTTSGWVLGANNIFLPIPAPCNGLPTIGAPPTVPSGPVTIDPLDYTLQASDCPGPLYFSAVPEPLPAGCSPASIATTPIQVDLNCPTSAIVINASPCVNVANTTVEILVSGVSGGSISHDITINGVPLGTFPNVSNPFVIPWTPASAGPANIEVTTTVNGCVAPAVLSGITVISGSPATPISQSFCTAQQPIDLSSLEDPAFPGGTWSGPNVVGNSFDAGPAASGPFVITYTPPAAAGCVAPGDATITITASTPTNPLDITVCQNDLSENLALYDDPAFPGGTWSGFNVVGGTTLVGPHLPGTYTLTYTPPPGGCAGDGFSTLTVDAGTPITFSPSSIDVCPGESFNLDTYLSPGIPSGVGTASGPFLSGTTVNVPTTFSGPLNYSYDIQSTGCFASGSFNVNVISAAPLLPLNGTVCENDGLVDLTPFEDPANPGLTWSGPFVSGGFFNATTAGPGTFTLTYLAPGSTAPNCFEDGTMVLTVSASTPLVFPPTTICQTVGSFDLNSLLPPAAPTGQWTGPTVVGSSVTPSSLGPGVVNFTYIPASPSCVPPSIAAVTFQSPTPVALTAGTACISDGQFDLQTLLINPSLSGAWSGPGVTGSFLDLTIPGIGLATVTFTPSGPNCLSATTTTVQISAASSVTVNPGTACITTGLYDLDPLVVPAGATGTWSGLGVSGSFLDPTIVGVGNTTVTFTPSSSSCNTPASNTVTVLPTTTVSLTSSTTLCTNSGTFDLSSLVTPVGTAGTWSGATVVGNTFDPALTGPGTFPVSFTPDPNACATGATTTIVVELAGPVQLNPQTLCTNSGPFDLNSLLSSAGTLGTWSGANVSGTNFLTAGLAAGDYSVTFTPTGGCSTGNSTTITIQNGGAPSLGSASVCISAGLYDLVALEDPAFTSGVWTGSGVAGSFLDPALNGVGPVVVTFTPSGNCLSSSSTTIQIIDAGTPSIAPITVCDNDPIIDLTTLEDPSFQGGTWSGTGVTGTNFDPSAVGPGSFTIQYTPLPNTCGNQVSVSVSISGTSQPVLVSGTQLCTSDTPILLTALQDPSYPGGAWSGAGVVSGTFDPSLAGAGTATLVYTPTGACAQASVTTITVTASGTPQLATFDTCTLVSPFNLSVIEDPSYAGGVWSGPGVAANVLDPSGLAAGTYSLSYAPLGACAQAATTSITLTSPTATTLNTVQLCDNSTTFDLASLVVGGPISGTWSGPGVASNVLDVPNAGLGQINLTFTPDADECTQAANTSITIYPATPPQFSNLSLCQSSTPVELNDLIPAGYEGGTWSGPINLGTSGFDPSSNGVYTFSYDSPGNCAPDATLEITVGATISINIAPLAFCINEGIVSLASFDPISAPGGVWSGSSVTSNLLDVTGLGQGNYTLTYTPPSSACGASAVQVPMMISPLTTVGLLSDTVCANSGPIDLNPLIDPSFATGSWSGSSVTPAGVFTPTNFDASNPVTFTPQAGCYSSTEFTFNMVGVSPLTASAPTFVCAPDGLSYTAEVQLNFNANSGQIQTDLGTLSGTLLVVTGLLSGSSPIANIDDAASCNQPIIVPLAHTCQSVNCITQAGTLSGGPYELCETDQLSPNASAGFVDDGDDVLVYVLDDDTDPTNGFITSGPVINFSAPAGRLDESLTLYAWAGTNNGSGSVLLTDTCASTSNALQVRWNSSPVATASAPVCDVTNTTYSFTISLTGGTTPFTQTTGPPGTFSPDGRTFLTGPIPSGDAVSYTFSDPVGCPISPVDVVFACNPTGCNQPDPGTFPNSPLTLCTSFVSDAGYNNDEVLGSNDVQVWVIYGDALGTNEIGRVTSLPIDFLSFASLGQTVYIASLAGENDGSGGVSATCFALSNLRPVSIRTNVQVPVAETLCSGEFLEFGGVIFDESNPSGTATIPGTGGACDTIYVVQLDFRSVSDTLRVFETICDAGFAFVGGMQFSPSNPSDTFSTGGNCDTVYMVDLVFGTTTSATIADTFCIGEALEIGGITFDANRPTGNVRIDNALGCDSLVRVDLVFIERSSLSISGPANLCDPSTITLDITVTGNYIVTGDVSINGTVLQSERLQPGVNTLTYNSPGEFEFSFNNIVVLGGCGIADIGSLFYDPVISRLDADIPLPISGDFVACGNTNVTSIEATTGFGVPPYTYLWSTGSTENRITDVPVGTFDVIITDNIGCTDNASVTVIETDTVTYALDVTNPLCPEGLGSIQVDFDQVPTGLEYRFDLPGISPVNSSSLLFEDLEEGTYVLQLIQENGCEQSQLIEVDDPLELNLIKQDTLVMFLGDTVSLLADAPANTVSFQWTPPTSILCDTCPRTVASPVRDITYFADLVTSNDCIVTDQIFVQVLPLAEIFIPTAFSPNGDATNDVFVPFAGPEVELISGFYVFDRWGELLHSAFNFMPGEERAGWDGKFRGRDVNPGVFVALVEVTFRDGTTKRFTGDVSLIR